MSAEENKATFKRFVEHWDKGSLDIVDELIHTDFIYHRPGMEDIRGRDGMKEWGRQFHAAFTNVNHIFEHLVAEDANVAFRFTITALHKGEFRGVPATNKNVEFTATGILRFQDGMVAEEWVDMDALGLLQQLGAINLA
jgi:steroid delta-isomerase-like uncharacterized protein